MFETKIKWHEASKELPDKSCDVVVACGDEDRIYNISDVHFSALHKMFNCRDYSETPETAFSDVEYWAYLDDVRSQFQKHEKKTAENGNSQTV